MPALAQETAQLAARVAEECKSLRTLINGNVDNLFTLSTPSKNNLVAAVNDVWFTTQSGIEWDNIQNKPLTFPATIGSGSGDAVAGNDSRLTDARTPTAHKATHATGGTDALTPSDIGAAPTSHTHTASEISDSTSTGRSLITTSSASAARTTLELGNAAVATTSTGGNGSSDSGKVLAFGISGDIKTTSVTVRSATGTTGLYLNPPSSSFASPTFVSGSYTVATTANTFGVPDNIIPPSSKTTPVDADNVVLLDSADFNKAKSLTFANLWTWIKSYLDTSLTIAGTKTFSALATFSSGIVSAFVRPSADSTTAFQIRKADGTTSVLSVDTTNSIVGIGTTTPSSKLDIVDTVLSGSGSLSGSALNIAQTWNTTGTPTAIKINVTDTASNSNSSLIDLQVGGANRLLMRKDGNTRFAATVFTPASFVAGQGIYGDKFDFDLSTNGLKLGSTQSLSWYSAKIYDTQDLVLVRDAANTLAQRRATNSQEFRLYNTYTDSSNYERLSFKGNSGGAYTITSQAAGTGTVQNIAIMGGSVGIGTSAPVSKLSVSGGDIEAETIGNGLVLKSPNGTRYRVTVDNAGVLATAAV